MRIVPFLFLVASCASPHVDPSPPTPPADPFAELHGAWSAPIEPFRIAGNLYYVGAANIASYLITTPAGHILIDTGTREMAAAVRASIAKLGFALPDVKILLSGHAHFDHVQGHAELQRATGAQVMALGDDAIALETGTDRSPLHAEGWAPVHVDRVLHDGDTVSLGGTTLRAVWAPGHTPGCTVWTTSIVDGARPLAVAFYACMGPNTGVPLIGNPRFPSLAAQSLASFHRLQQLSPDLWLLMHPAEQFAGKLARLRAGRRPTRSSIPPAGTRCSPRAKPTCAPASARSRTRSRIAGSARFIGAQIQIAKFLRRKSRRVDSAETATPRLEDVECRLPRQYPSSPNSGLTELHALRKVGSRVCITHFS